MKNNWELEPLNSKKLAIYQSKNGYRFTIDSVLLAHFALFDKNSELLADLGTGSGVLPLLLSTRMPKANITGFELQPQMVEMARASIKFNSLQQKIEILEQDLRSMPGNFSNKYDHVFANPPYFRLGSTVVNPKEEKAIARHEVACSLEQVIIAAARLLKEGGFFHLVTRVERLVETLNWLTKHKLYPSRLRMVQAYPTSDAYLFLLSAKRIKKLDLVVEPPLIIFSAKGKYTAEVLHYFNG